MEKDIYCNNCGEDESFQFMYSRAQDDWYKCDNCGQEITVSNL